MNKLHLLGTYCICILMISCVPVEQRPLVLTPLVSNHMVIQQQDNVTLWGTYTAEQEIAIKGSWGDSSVVTSDAEGSWHGSISTPNAGGPYQLTFTSSDTSIIIDDVWVGEVWLASGQSNMEMPLSGYMPTEPIDNYEEEIDAADYPQIRMFKIPRTMSPIPTSDYKGEWHVCDPEHAGSYSATAYFFARKLHQDLGVPIGIVHSSWGGTTAEAWTSREGLESFPHMTDVIDSHDVSAMLDWVPIFERIPQPQNEEEFLKIDFEDRVMSDPDTDVSTWSTCHLPLAVCHTDSFIQAVSVPQKLNGAFWYRKQIEMTPQQGTYTLRMGAIDDADATFVNGQRIGTTWNWQAKRNYTFDGALLQAGTNTIAIKHYDGGGGSNINGPMELVAPDGRVTSVAGSWSSLFYGDLHNSDIIIYGQEHQEKLSSRPFFISGSPNDLPSSLYNGMIHPIQHYTIQGAIWYQGESNVGRAEEYTRLFPTMIEDWRARWGREFPFYYVQIAPFGYGNGEAAALRDAQRRSLATPSTGMAITSDIGHPTSIHPGDKQSVGARLARLALSGTYDREVVASGPLYQKRGFAMEGKAIRLTFIHVGDGLVSKDGSDLVGGFEIAGEDGVFVPATAKITGESEITAYANGIDHPHSVRYGWADYFEATLFNKTGLPASSFTTE